MSKLIPKHLIIYKAARHRENFPVDIKYGYYSDKVFSSLHATDYKKGYSNFHRRYQKKLVQEISLSFHQDDPRLKESIRVIPRFSGIKKCTIDTVPFSSLKKDFMIMIFQRLFQVLKRIKKLVFYPLGDLQNSPRALKSLLLLNNLESLMFFSLQYSEDVTQLKPFLKTLQSASKRGCWPHFKSLKIHPFLSEHSRPGDQTARSARRLNNLLEFIKEFKTSCELLYKCSSFQFSFSSSVKGQCHQSTDVLKEIVKNTSSVTSIDIFGTNPFVNVSEVFEHSKDLKKLSLWPSHDKSQNFDLSVLSDVETFEELEISMSNRETNNLIFYKNFLRQIQNIFKLTDLSLNFEGQPLLTEEQKFELCGVISGLKRLTKLELKFWNHGSSSNHIWLGDVFETVGQKDKLQKLSFEFMTFDFKDSKHLFKILCQSVGKLVELSDFGLRIMSTRTIGDQEIFLLCQYFKKLSKIQELNLRISADSSDFQSNILYMFMNHLAESFPHLSQLTLMFEKADISQDSLKILYQAIQKMKSLNFIKLMFSDQIDCDVDFSSLLNEIRKRVPGNIYHNLQML